MLRGLYEWVMRLSASPRAPVALALIAVAESSFFPIPPDVMLVPMVLTRPERTWRYAAICAASSIIGGIGGYLIGYGLAPFAHWLLVVTGLGDAEVWLRAEFAKWGLGVILLGLLPIPFKLLTIVSGLAHFTFWKFMVAATVIRSVRFFGVAGLVKKFGPTMLPVIERRLALVSGIVVVIAAIVLLGVKLLHR